MIKLKNILKESFDRNAKVIDSKGKLWDVKYHGDIIYKFDDLKDTVISMYGYNAKEIKHDIETGTSKINNVIDSFGFIRCGIWSPSKREIYINWFKPTKHAINGFIKFVSTYKPTGIYVEDIKHPQYDGMYTVEEFIEEYL